MREMLEGNLRVRWFKEKARSVLPQGRFARGVTVLAGGAALGQVVVVLVSPILTRLYTPEDFGVLAVYISILGIVSVIASMRYELAIPLPEKDDDAIMILVISLGIVATISLFTGFVVWILGEQIVDWINVSSLKPYLWLLPVSIALIGTYQVLNYWAVRKQNFRLIAKTRIYQGLGASITQISFGFLITGPIGLILGYVIGQVVGINTLAATLPIKNKHNLRVITLSKVYEIAARYRRFPIYSSWAGLMNTLSVQLPILLLSFFFGPIVTGLYALSYRVTWIPVQLISNAVSQVFFSSAAIARREGNLATTTEIVFKHIVAIASPFFLLFALIAPDVIAFIFGQQWSKSGLYVQWLLPWLFVVFISAPFTTLFDVLEKQHLGLVFQAVLLTSRSAALIIGGILQNQDMAVWLFAIVSAICWFIVLLWVTIISGNKIIKFINILAHEGSIAIVQLLPFFIVKSITSDPLWILAGFGVSASLVVYRITLRYRKWRMCNG